MRYGSVCSGIEAASVAWESLGWEAQWYSEIEPFPSAVLAHRFPTVPNLGDMTLIHETQTFNDSTIDLLVGGTPCQSFSVAGLRKGLTDPRGNLMLTFLSLAERKKPRWIVWENVPGVLSSNGGRDFATFLTALGDIGYGFAYRVLDAQYFGVAQRRRRVFVVAYLGDWRPCASVLFESDCLQGNSKESREKRKTTSIDAQRCYGGSGNTIAMAHGQANAEITINDTCPTISCVHESPIITQYAHAFKVRGGSEDNTGEQGGTPGKKAGKGYLGQDEKVFTIGTTQDQQISVSMAIRRLTPKECERLQGFPDDWTLIPYRNKSADQCPDGPRYKACGNSMAVPVMRWIGQRIDMVEQLMKEVNG
jgi:DNA (cytosine-5)-methyltransferase 1